MSQPPFEAYTGAKPYIFVSYAHKDSERVYPVIHQWHMAGYRIWYDEGIDPGNEWPEEIAAALSGCRQFFVFITDQAITSKNVKNEINFALDLDRDFIAIHLDPVELPAGLRLRMGDIQAIMKYPMPDAMFLNKINKVLHAETLDPLKKSESPHSGNHADLPAEKIGPSLKEPTAWSETDPEVPSFSREYTNPPPGPKGMSDNIQQHFKNRQLGQMTIGEIKSTLVDDFQFIKTEVTGMIKNEWGKQKYQNQERKKERQLRKQAAEEKKRTRKEIRQQFKNADRDLSHGKSRAWCLPIPLSVIVVGALVYYLFFFNSFSSLSEDFLETACPDVYSRDQKIGMISSYEDDLSRTNRKIALEEAMRKCELGGVQSQKIKEMDLESKAVGELETIYLDQTGTPDTYKKVIIKRIRQMNLDRLKEKMNPGLRVIYEDIVEENYKEMLIDLIVDSQQPADG